jgi:predicted peptidase
MVVQTDEGKSARIMMKALLLTFAMATLLACGAAGVERSLEVLPSGDRLQVKSSAGTKLDFLLFVPAGYEKSPRQWPVILYLHGSGECGTNLNFLKRNGPTKYVLSHPEFPFILVAPQTKGGWDGRALVRLLDAVEREYRVKFFSLVIFACIYLHLLTCGM